MTNTTKPVFESKTVLAKFPSASKPGLFHEVRIGADGVIYCTCPSWRFQKNHPACRCCKHTKAFMARATHGGAPLEVQGEVEMPKPIRAKRASRKPARTFWEKL